MYTKVTFFIATKCIKESIQCPEIRAADPYHYRSDCFERSMDPDPDFFKKLEYSDPYPAKKPELCEIY